ncbi:MAG TPA: DnaJ domain-containing protein [Candidatus Obscuribacterales bacterium]
MFEIKQGLFQFEFMDNHGILGVSLEAEFDDIRKRYMQIARRLHPDTCPFENPQDRELAKQLLAKLVSPAYNQFSKEAERKEYTLLLKTIGDRIVKEQHTLKPQTESAQKLLQASDYQNAYESAIKALAKNQYESPEKVLEVTGEMSELNLVYLLRKNQKGAAPPSAKVPETTPTPHSGTPKKDSFVEQACHRAEQLMASQNYIQAASELKDAIKRQPDNSHCHGLLGLVYLKQNQPKLATPHINRALQLDPKQPQALEAKKELEKSTTPAGTKSKTAQQTAKKSDKSSGGGLFGGLFGGKKK